MGRNRIPFESGHAEEEPEADHQLTAPTPHDLFEFEQSISEEASAFQNRSKASS